MEDGEVPLGSRRGARGAVQLAGRTFERRGEPAFANAEKSCSPTNARAASSIAPRSSAAGTQWAWERPQAGASFLVGHARTLTALGRFQQAEDELLEALAMYEDTSVLIKNPHRFQKFTAQLFEAFVELYGAWHTAEPDKGYEGKAAEWRAKLQEVEGQGDEVAGAPP